MKIIDKIQNVIQLNKAIKTYGEYYSEYGRTFRSVLHYYVNKKNYKIAIWGAGLKGKAFLKIIDPNQKYIKWVYDIDKEKYGTYMPTDHKIVDYTKKSNQCVQVVLLMNTNYETETASLLKEQGMEVILINIDSIIAGELTAKEVVKSCRKEPV